MARKQILIQNFSGGVSDDVRQTGNVFAITKHFDIFSAPNKLRPYKGRESAYASQSTIKHQNFLFYNAKLYALGVVTATTKAQIDTYTGIDNPTVATPTNAQDASGSTDFFLFVQYKGKIYGSASTRVWSYDIAGTTFTATARSLAATAQGIVHSKSDTLFIPCTNVIARLNSTTWTDAALTLPSNYIITSLCEYGNYLAIACRPAYSGAGPSKVFLWDMISADVTEVIDFPGDLYAIENLGNILVGVSKYVASNSTFPSKIILTQYNGATTKIFKKIPVSIASVPAIVGQQKVEDRFYFGLTASSFGGSTNDYTGLWCIAKNEDGQFAVTLDTLPSNTANLASQMKGFFVIQEYTYISFLDSTNSDAFAITKTNDAATYDATSILETQKYNGGNSSMTKEIVGIAVMTEPIPSGGSYTVKMKRDAESSYTTVATNSTANSLGKEHINIESTQAALGECKELQLQVTSTGGCVPTGVYCIVDDKKTLLQLK